MTSRSNASTAKGKFNQVAQGVAEIQRIIVAREVLGEHEQAIDSPRR